MPRPYACLPALVTLLLVAAPAKGQSDEAFLDDLQERTFRYFWDHAAPETGCVRDRSTAASPCSIAATGFGLSALTVGIDRGWITREQGLERTLATLAFFRDAPMGPGGGTTGYRGFFYHFLDMEHGLRTWGSELSSIDTALLVAGVLHAGEYFDRDDPDEARVRRLAREIYERVDWAWMQQEDSGLLSMGWTPEGGFLEPDWQGYNEAMILYLLALGSPTHPVGPEAWDAWTATYEWRSFRGHAHVNFSPLFGHQYSHVWVDFRGLRDAYMREKGIDYFENSRRAALAQRAYAAANPGGFEGYGEDFWGLTASDGPGGYAARGASALWVLDDGTVAPTAAGGSIAFTPEASLAALRHMRAAYPEAWGRYGFRDALNPTRDWVASDYLGIDQGPILLMAENYRTGRVWEVFMRNEAVRRGLDRAGFRPAPTAADPVPPRPGGLRLEPAAPNPFAGRTTLRFVLPEPGPVRLAVFDLLGRRVATLVDGVLAAGEHRAVFDASGLRPGLYLARLTAAGAVRTRPVTHLGS